MCFRYFYSSFAEIEERDRAREKAHHICPDEFTAAKHVDPEAEKRSQIALIFVKHIVLKHAVKSLQLGVHGEQQGVEIASDILAVLGSYHLDIRVVG